MAKSKVTDSYVNKLTESITMSGANTLTFQQINMGIGLFQGAGMVISRIEYYPGTDSIHEVQSTADYFQLALVTSAQLASIDITSASVIDTMAYVGNGAGIEPDQLPIIRDFSTYPGGGLLVAPNPLYLAMGSAGFTAAGTAKMRLLFTFLQLQSSDYLELIQAQLPANL